MWRKAKRWSSTREAELQAANNGGRPWEAIPTEEWIKRAWGKVENEERKMLVEGIDDPVAEGGDRWGAVGERAQLVEEEERKKGELSESEKAKT